MFQAQHSAEEFGFTGWGVNCNVFTASMSLTELGSNSCAHLSESLYWEKTNESEATDTGGQVQEVVVHSAHASWVCGTISGKLSLPRWSDLVCTCSPDLPCLLWRWVTQDNNDLHMRSTLHFLKFNNVMISFGPDNNPMTCYYYHYFIDEDLGSRSDSW